VCKFYSRVTGPTTERRNQTGHALQHTLAGVGSRLPFASPQVRDAISLLTKAVSCVPTKTYLKPFLVTWWAGSAAYACHSYRIAAEAGFARELAGFDLSEANGFLFIRFFLLAK
jgi:hypothetical protein